MSQPKRWSHGLTGMSRNRSGPWVTWDDYAALAAENERLTRLLLDLSDAVHFHRANADTAKCSATIDRIVAEVDKMHPIS